MPNDRRFRTVNSTLGRRIVQMIMAPCWVRLGFEDTCAGAGRTFFLNNGSYVFTFGRMLAIRLFRHSKRSQVQGLFTPAGTAVPSVGTV
jgi:hypothetical protein